VEKVVKQSPLASVRENSIFKEFIDMQHGWTNRGDLSDPLVKRDYIEAMSLCLSFFQENM
jgi:hypothetical protein